MSENPSEHNRYSEEEARKEAGILSDMVKDSKGQKDYADAERWLKNIGREVRSQLDEQKFKEVRDALDKLRYWDHEHISAEARREEVVKSLHRILENKKILVDAYEYKKEVMYYIVQIMDEVMPGVESDEKRKLKDFGLDLAAELSPKIVKDIQKGAREHWMLTVLEILAKSHDDRKLGLDALVSILDAIEKSVSDKGKEGYFRSWSCFEALELVRNTGTQEQVNKTAETVFRIVEKIQDRPECGSFVSLLLSKQTPEIEARGLEVVGSILERHNLPRDLTKIWKKSHSEFNFDMAVKKNITALITLESKKPGICQFLYKEFGIADFGRYPVDLLLKQHEEAESLANPYGVIIFPQNDWNGAFYNDVFALERFYEKLEGEFSLRVVECAGKMGVARALIKLDKKYNPPDKKGHKISLAIIGGHGTEDSIQFGGEEERNALHSKDLMGKGVRRTSEFFEENPTIILNSCSTGADKGIGQKLSGIMGAKVVAPKASTSIREIQVGRRRGGKFRFNARYLGDSQNLKSVYVGGQEKQRK